MAYSVLQRVAYPIVVVCGVFTFALLRDAGMGLLVSAYLPVAAGALAITVFERLFPYRVEWGPNRSEVLNDFVFAGVVQVVVPKLLSFLFAVTLLRYLTANGLTADSIWPHDANVYLQASAMMLAAEFFRYWLHRASHEFGWFWKIHAVHHSPHKLYWTNVARFHPLDKALQYLFDTLPFLVLGVSEEVLAIYFVFYALNGFFQHCNIDVRLGFLNYVISGPELHRWHHSFVVGEANQNYGNNLIVWDLLFGTWFLPDRREVGELGLKNRTYPTSFSGQMKAPFIRKIEEDE